MSDVVMVDVPTTRLRGGAVTGRLGRDLAGDDEGHVGLEL
jgi:hypothetical protein